MTPPCKISEYPSRPACGARALGAGPQGPTTHPEPRVPSSLAAAGSGGVPTFSFPAVVTPWGRDQMRKLRLREGRTPAPGHTVSKGPAGAGAGIPWQSPPPNCLPAGVSRPLRHPLPHCSCKPLESPPGRGHRTFPAVAWRFPITEGRLAPGFPRPGAARPSLATALSVDGSHACTASTVLPFASDGESLRLLSVDLVWGISWGRAQPRAAGRAAGKPEMVLKAFKAATVRGWLSTGSGHGTPAQHHTARPASWGPDAPTSP